MKDIESLLPLLEKLKEIMQPSLIILFSPKYDGEYLSDLDICVVTDMNMTKRELLRRAYLETDCHIPYDIFIYTSLEWESLKGESGSFVSRIIRKGYVWYEQNPPN